VRQVGHLLNLNVQYIVTLFRR